MTNADLDAIMVEYETHAVHYPIPALVAEVRRLKEELERQAEAFIYELMEQEEHYER